MIRKIEVQGVRTNSRPFSLTKQPTHTGRNTPTPGEPKASPGSSQPRDKSCLGIQQICVGKVHPPACKAAVWGFHFISQAFKMPKGKAFRRTLRVTSLFFGSKGFARIFVAQDLRNLLQGSEVRGQLNPLFLLQFLSGHHLLVLVSPQLPRAVLEGEGLSVVFLRPC